MVAITSIFGVGGIFDFLVRCAVPNLFAFPVIDMDLIIQESEIRKNLLFTWIVGVDFVFATILVG